MSVASRVLQSAEEHLPRVIDARTHGALDYLHVALCLGMAWRWRKRRPRAAVAALVTGSVLLAESLCTDYPLGAVKGMSFSTHGRMDKLLAVTALQAPRVFGFDGTAEAAAFEGATALRAAVVIMTDYESDKPRWRTAS
jgi:hypothetical protein